MEGLGGFLPPWGRWVVTTCGHAAGGICSACSSLLVLLFALSRDSLVAFSSFYLGSGERMRQGKNFSG